MREPDVDERTTTGVTSLGDAPPTGSRSLGDAEVFARAVRRPEELAVVFDRHAPEILRYLTRRVGPTDAEDLLGDVFVIALQRRASFDASASSARPWLYGIASNLLHRRRRDEARFLRALARAADTATAEDHPADIADDIAARVDSQQANRRLAAALADLDARDRDVVLLRAWGQLSHEEIATSLQIPVGTVKSRLHRARKHLRQHLESPTPAPTEGEPA
jgi:RNA polymerase sigma-70 factor (ECF subfamily)